MNKHILPNHSLNLLFEISKKPEFNDFYLAGGTALALQIGHRISIDLDFFAEKEFPANLINEIKKPYEVISLHNNSIEVIMDETKVFFFRFSFPLVNEIQEDEGVKLAHPIDIGLMKLLALQGRTTKKDIIDLFFIDKEVIRLEELLELFENHYPKESFNSYASLKQLLNFETLKEQPMPRMFKDASWEECKEVVTTKVSRHISNLLS